MDLKYGDILIFGTPYYGSALMMVVNPPVVCESCGKPIQGWERDESGFIPCPSCGHLNEHPEREVGRDGEELITLAVAANVDDGTDSPNWTPIYNYLVNKTFTVSLKSLMADIEAQRARVCSEEEAFNRKCMIVWTNTPGYYAGAPCPEWIKEMIRGEQ